jgi:hypothetical protein
MHSSYDNILRKICGDAFLGALDYWRFPKTRSSWGGPFNGQIARRHLFHAIVGAFQPRAIIETGTYRGTTTDLMAATGLPIYTIENDPRLYGYSRMRFYTRRNVNVLCGDSRKTMTELFTGPLQMLRREVLFVYLDAHWEHDLPLTEELDIVFAHAPNSIAMIDDFQVPFDPGYRYDRYRSGKALTPGYIAPVVEKRELAIFYPSTESFAESGAKRGCAVLAARATHEAKLSGIELLRAARPTP